MAMAMTACSSDENTADTSSSEFSVFTEDGEAAVDDQNSVVLEDEKQSTSDDAEVEPTIHGVGDTVEAEGVKMTLLRTFTSTGSQYFPPEAGNIFLLCEFELENTSAETMNVSSLMQVSAYCDDYSCDVSMEAVMGDDAGESLDGEIAAGKRMKGVVGFQVPETWAELEVHFNPIVFGNEEIVFLATNA